MVDPLSPSLPLLLLMAGVVISVLEALAPGAHFVVLGTALMVAGLAGVLFPPLGAPLALAAIVLAVGGVSLWTYRNFDIYGGSGTAQTSDSQTLSGRRGVVTERVTQTSGRVRLFDGGFDPSYTARALDEPIDEETEIIVVDPGGGSVLTVAPIDDIDDDAIDRALARERERTDDHLGDASESSAEESADMADQPDSDSARNTETDP